MPAVTDVKKGKAAKKGETQYHIIGGAKLAAELDAKRAIRDGAELAAKL